MVNKKEKENKKDVDLIREMLETSKARQHDALVRISEGIEKLKQNKIKLAENKKKLAENKIRLQALREFKERTGLTGQELKKAFYDWWDTRPKSEDGYKIIEEQETKLKKSKTTRTKTIDKKGYSNVLKGRTDLKYNDGKLSADSEVKVRKGLNPKEKRAIKTSINKEVEKALMNGGKIILDEESEDEFEGEGLKTNSIILKHLMEHITDPKEKIDPKDFKQSKMLIDEIKTEKRKRGRPPKYSTQPEPRPIGRPKGTGGKSSKITIDSDLDDFQLDKYIKMYMPKNKQSKYTINDEDFTDLYRSLSNDDMAKFKNINKRYVNNSKIYNKLFNKII